MLNWLVDRRKLAMTAALAFLAGCQVIPKGPAPEAPPPVTVPTPNALPDEDVERHRVALLVPLSGSNAEVGQSIANAATMALLDTNADNLRVTTYDTSSDPSSAASRAINDGNALILGPLLSDNIPAVSGVASRAGVPVISFSNDETAASSDVFIMGTLPSQSVDRTVRYARSQGIASFGALVPRGEYGQRASSALMSAARASGASVIGMEAYDRGNTSLVSAAERLKAKGGYGAVLMADSGRMAARAAPVVKAGAANPRILGTELWSGEGAVANTPALEGAWFAAVPDARFRQFSESYKSRFGSQPYRIATLGYDAVLLSLRIAREWTPGRGFPRNQLLDKGGFLGLDGPFRFSRGGVIERALEVRQVTSGGFTVVSPAPTRFED